MSERRLWAGGIPLLIIEPDTPPTATVLVYHGLLASKDTQRKELELLARRGLRAVGVDAVGHGERAWDDLAGRLDHDSPRTLLEIVTATVDEIPWLLDEMRGGEPFAMTGISMGAYITFGALASESRLGVGVPILGNPNWVDLTRGREDLAGYAARSPHLRPEAFAHKRVLAMNAGRDVNVPPAGTRNFMTELQARYGAESFQYREFAESDHFMRPDDWADLWLRAELWLGLIQ